MPSAWADGTNQDAKLQATKLVYKWVLKRTIITAVLRFQTLSSEYMEMSIRYLRREDILQLLS